MRLWGEQFGRTELLRRVGGFDQIAGVRLVTLGDGNERGVRVLEFRTGTGFAFDVIVDRAFDIGRCELAGKALGWQSGVGYGGPWFAEHEGLGWLRNWGGGLVTTCGLDHALFGAEDTATQYHYLPKETESFGLHGRISNRPGKLTAYGERWEGDECVLYAEGEVLQASVFGERLLLRRRVEARVGESRLMIHDEVENVGWDPTPHVYLYHVNIGFPVVDEGAELLVPTRSVTPRGDYSSEGYRSLDGPEPAHYERVYEHDVIAEADGSVPVGIVNRARGI
ncbi:MAG: hypothetical protein QOF33_3216, partial [Thermomicrobiales bacterium]|nr:hypothetical protein [Thermomicrobiales bacterium]